MTPASLAIVIPSRRPSSSLIKCLGSISQQWPEHIAGEIIVVDDGSGQDYSLEIGNWFPHVKLNQLSVQSGAGTARNLGVQNSNSEWIVFLDDDCTVPWNWTISIIDYIRQNPHIAMTGATVLSKNPRNWVSQTVEDFILKSKFTADGDIRVITACAIVNRSAFLHVGGFDPRFTGAGGEDWDLSQRMSRVGLKLGITESVQCYHENPETLAALIRMARRYGASSILLSPVETSANFPNQGDGRKLLRLKYHVLQPKRWWKASEVAKIERPWWSRQRERLLFTLFLLNFRIARRKAKRSAQ